MKKNPISSPAKRIIPVFHLVLLVVSALPVLLSANRPVDLDTLLAKHLEALGGRERVLSIRSVVTESDMEIKGAGMKGSMTSWSLKPCLSYLEYTLGFFNVRQGFDGSRSWSIGPNGKLQFQQDENSVRRQATTCIINDFTYTLQPELLDISIAKPDTALGTLCEVVLLFPQNGIESSLYIDPVTFLIRKITLHDRSGTIEQTFHDYRDVDGIMFPFRTVTHMVAMGQVIEVRVKSISVNSSIDPAIFLPPGTDVSDYRFTTGSSSENIPFTYRSQHIYIPLKLEDSDKELIFLLDSGASMTVIDSTLAASIGLESGGKIAGAGAGGMADFHMTRIKGFSIQGIEFSGQTLMTYPLAGLIGGFSGIDTGGILGYDFLSRFVTRIDYENSSISFFEPDSFTPPPDAVMIESPLVHNIFSCKSTLDGKYQGSFLIDTGASGSILQKSFTDKNLLLDGKKTLRISIAGAGGTEDAVISRFGSFELGGIILEAPVFTIPSVKTGIGVFEDITGVIGNDILQRFTVYLDYSRQRIYLRKNSSFGRPFSPDKCGLQAGCNKKGQIVIRLVMPGTPAYDAGLIAGDIIVSIDGASLPDCGSLDKVTESMNAREGSVVRIDFIRDGEKKSASITLKSYI